ncbi:MAG: HD-GYP domain-containing protein [Actinomycetota bacterium]|nr:HD-GYP domain-containing protein [Actinomycetota bacterium]
MSNWPIINASGDPEVERTRARLTTASKSAELRTAALLLAAFCGGALLLSQTAHANDPPWGMFGVLAVLYAVSGLVEFEVGAVYTDCSLPVLAAMMIALPPVLLPWGVAIGTALSAVVKAALGARHVSRVLPAVAQASLPALVPAAVLVALPPITSWPDAPAIAGALGAYIAADLLISLVFLRLAYGEPLALPSLGEAWVYGIDLLLAPVGIAMAIAAKGQFWAVAIVFLPLALLLRVFANERRARIDQALELSHAYRGTAMLLGDMVETDDAYTGSHSRDVVDLAVEVGTRMGLEGETLRDLEFGALLHDVGKIAVPKAIINKPGSLTAQEWAIVKRHTVVGQRMLENVGGVLARVGVIVRSSHEDFDGTGYPDGLASDAIPIEARICSACDAFSAMTTHRSYRAAMTIDAALAELHRCSGTQFDPAVVTTLAQVVEADEVRWGAHATPAALVQAVPVY